MQPVTKLRSLIRYIRCFRNWPVIAFARYRRPRQLQPVSLLLRNGFRLTFRPGSDYTAVGEVFVGGSYDSIVDLADAPPVCVWDVGGNIGAFVVWAAALFPAAHFVSFEPVPETFALLQRNQRENAAIDWTVQPFALGDRAQMLDLYIPHEQFGQASRYGSEGRRIEVSMRAIEQVWVSEGRPVIDLMKLDCEGGEYAILDALVGPMLGAVRNIVMETHTIQDHEPSELSARLQAAGFVLEPVAARNPNMLWARWGGDNGASGRPAAPMGVTECDIG